MTNFLYSAGAFIVVLGVLITVHEFGHFWVAHRLGVKVLRFSIGFGKPLWSRRVGKDNMELAIGAFPLGGYVQMLDETEGDMPASEAHRAFNRQHVGKRMAIVVAGPLFNFLFAIVAFWAIYMIGVDGIQPVVGKVVEGSIAQRAGFQAGDTITAIDGKEVQSWSHRRLYVFQRALDRARVMFEVRDGQGRIKHLELDLSNFPVQDVDSSLLERGIGLLGYFPEALPVIGAIEPGPALRAGMEVGDRLVEIDSQPARHWEEFVALVRQNPGRALHVVVERHGQRLDFNVTPDAVEQEDRTIGRINIRPQFSEIPDAMRVKVRYGPLAALTEGIGSTWNMSMLSFEMLYRMLKLEVSARNISGPISIAQHAGDSAQVGPEQFVLFLAFVSISLGVLNLLPIPVLDGGQLMYFIIEAVKGRPLSENVRVRGQQLGVVLLVGLTLLAFYNDLTRIFF